MKNLITYCLACALIPIGLIGIAALGLVIAIIRYVIIRPYRRSRLRMLFTSRETRLQMRRERNKASARLATYELNLNPPPL